MNVDSRLILSNINSLPCDSWDLGEDDVINNITLADDGVINNITLAEEINAPRILLEFVGRKRTHSISSPIIIINLVVIFIINVESAFTVRRNYLDRCNDHCVSVWTE